MRYEIVEQHDDGNVDQIIGNQDGCQCTFRIFTKLKDLAIGITLIFIKLIQVVRR